MIKLYRTIKNIQIRSDIGNQEYTCELYKKSKKIIRLSHEHKTKLLLSFQCCVYRVSGRDFNYLCVGGDPGGGAAGFSYTVIAFRHELL